MKLDALHREVCLLGNGLVIFPLVSAHDKNVPGLFRQFGQSLMDKFLDFVTE